MDRPSDHPTPQGKKLTPNVNVQAIQRGGRVVPSNDRLRLVMACIPEDEGALTLYIKVPPVLLMHKDQPHATHDWQHLKAGDAATAHIRHWAGFIVAHDLGSISEDIAVHAGALLSKEGVLDAVKLSSQKNPGSVDIRQLETLLVVDAGKNAIESGEHMRLSEQKSGVHRLSTFPQMPPPEHHEPVYLPVTVRADPQTLQSMTRIVHHAGTLMRGLTF